MQHISINGEKYVKASSIARELGYTADYVGQLCRGGKVDAQLVGRSWYVSESSIRDHKQSRYRSTSAKSKEAVKRVVEETVKQQSVMQSVIHSPYTSPLNVSKASYESDYHDLIPSVPERKREEFVASPVEIEEYEAPEVAEDAAEDDHEEEVTIFKPEIDERRVKEEEVEQEELNDEVVAVPIRAIHTEEAPRRRRWDRKTHMEPVLTPVIANQEVEQEEVIVASGGGGIILRFAVLAVAFLGMLTFIGLENHIVADDSALSASYSYNFATVIEATKNIGK